MSLHFSNDRKTLTIKESYPAPAIEFSTHGIGPLRAYVGDYCIYKHDADGNYPEHYSVSEHQVWVEGVYASPEAALCGARLHPSKLA